MANRADSGLAFALLSPLAMDRQPGQKDRSFPRFLGACPDCDQGTGVIRNRAVSVPWIKQAKYGTVCCARHSGAYGPADIKYLRINEMIPGGVLT